MSGLILHLSISQSHVFLLNSRLGLFTAASLRWRLFSRSYETILPSSLAMNHSSTLGFSPRLPVSVYGTGGCNISLEVFLGSRIRHTIHSPEGLWYYQASAQEADLPTSRIPTLFNEQFRLFAVLSLLRHPITVTVSTGILTSCPSTTPFGFALGPD